MIMKLNDNNAKVLLSFDESNLIVYVFNLLICFLLLWILRSRRNVNFCPTLHINIFVKITETKFASQWIMKGRILFSLKLKKNTSDYSDVFFLSVKKKNLLHAF